jgi:transposase
MIESFNNGTSAAYIYELIKADGYTGSERNVRYHANKMKNKLIETIDKNIVFKISKDKLTKILWKDREKLSEVQDNKLSTIIEKEESIDKLHVLTQDIKSIIRTNDKLKLQHWLVDAANSRFKEFKTFVNGIYADFKAVNNTLSFNLNNALLEGHVNRLKTIKRQMYGRANITLLRQKVLYQF